MIFHGTDNTLKGCLFDIQGFSVHDGPGCRTLLFFKGCTLNCLWCSNPEGISSNCTPLYSQSKCIKDWNCINNCPHNAIKIVNDRLIISGNICRQCKTPVCKDSCYTGALCISGYEMSTHELFSVIQRDRQYWGASGGVTLTGGEPLLQADFAQHILSECYHAYIHTAIETCGNVPWESFEKVIPYVDWFFYDLKHMDAGQHIKGTGGDNLRIIENATRLADKFQGRLIFRLPLITGYNDSDENMEATALFVLKTGRKEINILPLHHFGREKYNLLGVNYPAADFSTPAKNELVKAANKLKEYGITCYIDNETPF